MRLIRILLYIALSGNATAQHLEDAYSLGVEGINQVDAGNYKEGIKLLKKARNLEPKEYDYTFEIGKAYYRSGNPKMAEKFLYPLQYHVDVQSDLFVLLADCYQQLEELKKNPNPERKKELDALRYGIQKLPQAGSLYLELGSRKLEMEEPIKALAAFENGIVNAPNFAANYFWASKLLKATGNDLWAWIYAEVFFNISENEEMKRTAGLLISQTSQKVFSEKWIARPEKMDQELQYLLKNKCRSEATGFERIMDKRKCLMNQWENSAFPIAAMIDRMRTLKEKGWLESYLASIYLESDKEAFFAWLAGHAKEFETYRKWRYWNPIHIDQPIQRILFH